MFSYIALFVLFISMVILGTSFVWAVRRNVRRSNKVREQMEFRLKELRLYNVLDVFRVDVKNYLHKNNIVDINGHMHTCDSCETTEYCDEHLCRQMPASEFHFCPNYLKLVDISANES